MDYLLDGSVFFHAIRTCQCHETLSHNVSFVVDSFKPFHFKHTTNLQIVLHAGFSLTLLSQRK